MKKEIIVLTVAAIAATGAYGQFGKLKERVKQKAKAKVEQTVNNAVDDAVDKAVDTAVDQTTKGAKKAAKGVMGDKSNSENSSSSSTSAVDGFDPLTFWKQSFEPNPEAFAVDNWAENTDELSFQTKTMKELHAAYDHLPEYYFPFHPYYSEHKMWYAYNGEYGSTLSMRWYDYMEKALKSEVGAPYMEYDYIKVPGQDYYLPLDYTMRNAFTADFVIDPKGSGPFSDFVRLLCFSSYYYCTNIDYAMEQPEDGLIHDDWFIYKGSYQKYKEWVNERENMCLEIACNVTPISVVQEHIISSFDNFKNEKYRMLGRLCGGISALAAYDCVLLNHKDYDENDETNQKIKRLVTVNKDKVRVMSNDFIQANKPAQAEPKGVSVDAATKTNGTAQAKQYMADNDAEFVKVIFLSNTWTPFKEQKWPYRVVVNVMPIAIVGKKDGKSMIYYCDLGKSTDGKSYTIQASMTQDPGPFPLK